MGEENETTLLTQYGTIPREIFFTGRLEDAGLLVANGRTGLGMAILSEVPGAMKRTEIAGWDDPEHVGIGVLYDTDLMPFERAIAGGEEFTTAMRLAGRLSQRRRLQRSALAAAFLHRAGAGAAGGCRGSAVDL